MIPMDIDVRHPFYNAQISKRTASLRCSCGICSFGFFSSRTVTEHPIDVLVQSPQVSQKWVESIVPRNGCVEKLVRCEGKLVRLSLDDVFEGLKGLDGWEVLEGLKGTDGCRMAALQ